MNRPIIDQIAWIIALLLSGVAAGMFLMDLVAYYSLLPQLPEETAIELHQYSLPLRRLAFRLAIGSSLMASLTLLVFFSEDASRRIVCASVACFVALIVFTNWAVIPLNHEIASWDSGSPPPGWSQAFAKMILMERIRCFVPVVAFALKLSSFAIRLRK